jgi:hypothetical protein
LKQRKENMPPSTAAWIACASYSVTIQNSDSSFVFELDVTDAKQKQYFLRVKTLNDRVGLVQKTLRVIADRWPAYAFEFQAEPNGAITDVR